VNEKYILVTGGAGYIGSHICKALSLGGYVPVTYDNLSTGNLRSVKWGPFVQADLIDELELNETFNQYDFSGVIHCAAKAYVGESIHNPIKYFEGNVSTTINLLKSMQTAKVSKLVFSSSCATYGETQKDKITESIIQAPINPYGVSKHICEQLIQSFAQTGSLEFAILRYFNAAGADPDGEIGELHKPETHLIPLALNAAITNSTFYVYGGDFDTPDGSAIRDYIHVSDIANAHVRAMNRLIDQTNSFICNIGSGLGYSVIEVMEAIKELFPNFKYLVKERRSGDPAKLVADKRLANQFLEFSSPLSRIDIILKTALQWHLSHNEKKQDFSDNKKSR